MDKHQIWAITLRALFLLSALTPNVVSAKYPYIPFTPLEQMSTLSSVARQAIAHKLSRSGAEATIGRLLYQRDYRARYLAASLRERKTIAKIIGEEGVERFAAERGWKPLLDSSRSNHPYGTRLVILEPQVWKTLRLGGKGWVIIAKMDVRVTPRYQFKHYSIRRQPSARLRRHS